VAAANKIRLTYFWADESVMAEDFRGKISKKMSEFARDFYGRYGFELDVKPGYEPGKVLESRRFALVKNDGVRPDHAALVQAAAESMERLKRQMQEIAEADRILKERQGDVNRLVARMKAASAAHDAAAVDATVAPLEAATRQLEKATTNKEEVVGRVRAEGSLDWSALDFETQFRRQLGFKWLQGVMEAKRLPIVFCKYVTHFLSMRESTFSVTGNTFQAEDTPFRFFGGDWLWSAPFVCLSIEGAESKGLAHEIVHAAGHPTEPPNGKRIKDLKRYVSYKPKPLTGSVLDRALTSYENYLEYQSLFEVVEGGYYAGDSMNDIMNYNADSSDPFASILTDDDKKLLDGAIFVRP